MDLCWESTILDFILIAVWFCCSYYKVKLTLESQNKEQVNAACDFLQENLPSGETLLVFLLMIF